MAGPYRNLARATAGGHRRAMRRIVLASTLLVAACSSAPRPAPVVTAPVVSAPTVREAGSLIGLNAAQLVARLGSPALQIREGSSLKLQFRNSRCVIDAYLYPVPGNPSGAVEHVDTRAPSGVAANQQVCIDLFLDNAN